MARLVNQKYGRWVVRFRMPRGAGTGMDVALRPNGNGTVVDWIESASIYGAKRNTETATLHYGHTRVHAKVHANFAKWHTMSLEWRPNRITVKLDGKAWANYTSHIPDRADASDHADQRRLQRLHRCDAEQLDAQARRAAGRLRSGLPLPLIAGQVAGGPLVRPPAT